MKIHELIAHFSSETNVPVDPDDVAEQIKAAGISDEIRFVGVDMDERKLKGALHSYVNRPGVYADPVIHSDIYYAKTLGSKWRRLVCCKELLHTLDGSSSKATGPEDIRLLLEGIVDSDGKAGALTTSGLQVWNDRLMVYYAMAILFPNAVRDLFLVPYQQGLLRTDYVSDKLDLPEMVIELVLSDRWNGMYKILAGKR